MRVELASYDSSWPEKFEKERFLLQELLAPWLAGPIEHIGSTAVPNLTAKPIIDMMAAVQTLEASRPAIEAVAGNGYQYFPYRPDLMHWFCKPSPEHRTHHLHLVPLGSALWDERLLFRDALRRDAGLAAQYEGLKMDLAEEFPFDREAYTEGKTAFVRRVLKG